MKTIILDMYGVILKESKGYFIQYVYNHFPGTDKNFLILQFNRASRGVIDSKELLESLGFADWFNTQTDYIDKHLTIDEEVIIFLQMYQGKYQFVLLSNDVGEWNTYIMQKFNLYQYIDQIIISANVGCRKPDNYIYEVTLKKINQAPANCIFIDNSLRNLDVALEMGIQTILFNRDQVAYDGKKVNSFYELSELLTKGDVLNGKRRLG